jgi:PST family polysaccharide transporter
MVTALAQAARFCLYFASTIALSRLLSKEDFGLVAMVGVLTSFLRVLREAGLSTATVQRDEISHAQVSNLFWINVALGAAAALVGAALSPAVAWFYRDPRLVVITIFLSATFLLSGGAVQHLALLNRQMRFKAMAVVDVGSMAAGLGVGIGMALLKWGYWSLVGSQLATALAELALAWSASQWRPQLPRPRVGTRGLVKFGASLTYSSLLRRITSGADTLLIGRFYGAGPLGLYSRGMALVMRPLDQFVVPFDQVFVPMLSRLQTDPERYRRIFLQVFSAIALVSFPMAGLLLGLSRPLVLVLLGPRWEEVIPIFSALALVALYYPLVCVGLWLPTTQGRTEDIVVLGTLISAISVISYVVGLPFGVAGVALAFSLSGLLVRMPLQFHVVGRSGPVSRIDLWTVTLSHLPLWAVSLASVYLTRIFLREASPALQLAVCLPVGLLVSFAAIRLIPSHRRNSQRLFNEIMGFLLGLCRKGVGLRGVLTS